MFPKRLLGASLRLSASVLGAGVFYAGWLAIFIPAFQTGIVALKGVGWLSAPLVTAAGFATGVMLAERLSRRTVPTFRSVFLWPVCGCVFGVATVFWVGPMLTLFGMFLAGAASIALRETVLWGVPS